MCILAHYSDFMLHLNLKKKVYSYLNFRQLLLCLMRRP